MFRICDGRGFHLKFENGYTVSVQFGPFNYCEKRDMVCAPKQNENKDWESKDAEIAIFNDDHWALPDMVQGWVSPDKVAQIISIVQKHRGPLKNLRQKLVKALKSPALQNKEMKK